jgi:uncharacterized membrane protein
MVRERGEEDVEKHRLDQQRCAVCGRSFPHRDLVSGDLVRPAIADLIKAEHPDWSTEGFICRADLTLYRGRHVHAILESERGELTNLEQQVVDSLREHEILSSNVDAEFEGQWTLGERWADRLATFGGSWVFLVCFALFLVLWIGANSVALWWRVLDPYPFILLNLVLSSLAAIQAPIIMMSQNRVEAKDRKRSQHDYQVNLKAELEIRQLHEKLDHLLSHQWERLVEIQEIQLELLSEVSRKR